MLNLRLLALFVILVQKIRAFYDPCLGKGGIGSACDYDTDCGGAGVICKLGVCHCHPNYRVRNDTDGTKYCLKSPDTVNASCTDQCRFPMFCNNGQCQCIRAKVEGNRCIVISNLGDTCTHHYECTLPFSACINGKCGCVTGTIANKGACVAAQQCPDGGQAKGTCIRIASDMNFIQNQFESTSISTCPSGFYCYTSDVSHGGHCCPQICPYSTVADSAYSCRPGDEKQCPLDTHYCHRLSGQSFSYGVCCRRPCKEPNPLYVNGKCYPRSWLAGPCTINEQCESGDGMQCVNAQCVCRQGYKPEPGSFSTSENPPQRCVRDCGSSLNSRSGECFASVGLGQQCDVDDQCPSNAKCFRGACFCNCAQGYSKNGGTCTKEVVTTQKPALGIGTGQGGILGVINSLFKGGGLGG